QLAVIGVTTINDGATWNRGRIGNGYSPSFQCDEFDPTCAGSDNNGNLSSQKMFIPQDDQAASYTSWLQTYHYDSLNRLKDGTEFSPIPSCPNCFGWAHTYQYDQYGNRTFDPQWTRSDVPWKQFTVDTSTNRLGVPSGQSGTMTYDTAGNLIVDTYTGEGQRDYDAENRMTRAWGNGQWQTYGYDGDDRRVKRIVNGTETWQVYGVEGELVAEYSYNGVPSNPQK